MTAREMGGEQIIIKQLVMFVDLVSACIRFGRKASVTVHLIRPVFYHLQMLTHLHSIF